MGALAMTTHSIERISRFLGAVVKPCRERLFEWLAAMMMIGIALLLIVSPQSLESGSYRYMLGVGLHASLLSCLCLCGGGTRLCALMANGLWPLWGPRLRAFGAVAGAYLWFQMFLALASFTSPSGPSIGLPVYFTLMVGEFVSCWRAATDVIKPRQ